MIITLTSNYDVHNMHSNKKYKSMFGQPGINLCPINYIQLVPNPAVWKKGCLGVGIIL